MPFVEVKWFEGRSEEQKAAVAEAFSDALIEIAGCDKSQVWIAFSDYPKSDWSVGGKICSKPGESTS